MAEYIDREKLRNKVISVGRFFKSLEKTEETKALRKTITCIVNRIDKIPAEDVAPVKHGEWLDNTEYLTETEFNYDGFYYDSDYICCSTCNSNFNKIDNCTETFNYCPNCGAKMDLEEQNNARNSF